VAVTTGDSTEAPGSPSVSDQVVDATRRTHLANERTFLAWLRTGLTAFAVAIGIGQLVPAYTGEGNVAYGIAGIGFALLGIALTLYGLTRILAVQRALDTGGYRPAATRALALISLAAVLLGGVLVVLLIVYA
jgi:putative membrane protein